MADNLTDSQRRPVPFCDSLPLSVVTEKEGQLAHYDPLGLHEPEALPNMSQLLPTIYLHHI